MTKLISILVVLGALSGSVCFAFQASHDVGTLVTKSKSPTLLNMAPKYNKQSQTWIPSDPATEGPEAGYNIIGSLYRAGPMPAITRLTNPENYEQAVLKFMAKEKCDRVEAQGNMDAYFENPQDWAYQKLQEQKGAPKRDYANANMDPQQIILSTIWAGVVVVFAYDLITGIRDGRYPGETHGATVFNGNLFGDNGAVVKY